MKPVNKVLSQLVQRVCRTRDLWGLHCEASGCSEPCLMVPPSENMRPLETLWMHIRCVWESIVPGEALAVGERNWWINYSFSVGGIWGEITSLPSLKTSRQTEISLSENYGQLESTLVMFAIPPSLFPFFLVFYFITIKCQNLWQKYLLCPRTPGLKHSPINCSCQNNAGLNPKNI